MNILALMLAGAKGSRLHPLTAEHAKPALPFANGYRIVDFVLSNLVNSGITSIYVDGYERFATTSIANTAQHEVAEKCAIFLNESRPQGRDVQHWFPAEPEMPHAGPESHAHMAPDFRQRSWISLALIRTILLLSRSHHTHVTGTAGVPSCTCMNATKET